MKKVFLITIIIASFSCSSNKSETDTSEALARSLYGGWVNTIENKWITINPDKYESWNLNDDLSDEGKWTIEGQTLFLESLSNPGKKEKFEIQNTAPDEIELVSESGALLPLSRRKYGEFQAQLSGSIAQSVKGINKACAGIQEIIKELPEGDPSSQKRIMGLWLVDGKPARLAVTEPQPATGFAGFSEYYFEGGMLHYEIGPHEKLVFENGHLVLWTDENDKIKDGDAAEIEKKQNQTLENIDQFLNLYGYKNEGGIYIAEQSSDKETGV